MSAVAQLTRGPLGWLSRWLPNERAVTQAFVSVGIFGLICSLIFPMHLQDRLPYSTPPSFPLAFFAVLACVALRGKAVLRRCAFDWIMLAWMALMVCSQLNAWLSLNRNMFEYEVVNSLITIMNMWFIFRAFYAFTIVDPQAAVRSTIFWLIIIIALCAIIGILQSVGPVQKQMIDLAYRIGVGEQAIKIGAGESGGLGVPRTTSVFSGPNIFGFINLIGGGLLIGAAMAYRHKMKELQSVLIVAGLAFFAYANLNSQSRATFVLAAGLVIVFLIYLIRAAKWRALLSSAILFVILVSIVVILASQGNFQYLTGIFETGIAKDASYQVRMDSFDKLARVVNDIPFFGAGQDFYSLNLYGRGDFYSKANGAADNGVLMAYFLLGLPGVVHLFFLNYVCFRALKSLKVENRVFISAMKNGATIVFWLFVITIPYAIRYPKFETMIYWLMVFGVVFGLNAIQRMRDQRLAELGLTVDDMESDPLPRDPIPAT